MNANTNARSLDIADELRSVELKSRRWFSQKAFEIELSRPASFEFKAGQTIRFVSGGIERYYSVVSSPDDPKLVLCVRSVKEGKFTPVLASAETGARFDLTGPHGYFTFKPSSRTPVFVATGTGIAPFVSMARSGAKGFTLLHGVSALEDLYYRSFFSKAATRYVPCISGGGVEDGQAAGIFQGRVTRFVRAELERGKYDFYLCGREEMVRDVTLLVDDFFPGSLVYSEVFF